jgi:D-3-phosphoglycerate dehydrogenase / 2-oxoglutarate reductase
MTVNRYRVLVARTMAQPGWDIFKARDDVEAIPYAPNITAAELHPLLRDVNAIVLSLTRFGAPELAAAPRIQVAARIGVGFDTVDVPALTARKIPLMTVGIANSPSVAEQAFSLLFALAKRNAANDSAVRSGSWRDTLTAFPVDFMDKTVLVVGFGRIGTRFAKRALGFEMRVLVYDPYVPARDIQAAGCEPVGDLDAAIARADFITVHCPKNAETTNLFDAARLKRMKPSAYIVNTARGGIINEPALAAALAAGTIAGAGVEVFEQEPAPRDHPLLNLPNVIVAPHLAGVTVESLERMAVTAARNVLSVLDGRPLRENAVNPEVFD